MHRPSSSSPRKKIGEAIVSDGVIATVQTDKATNNFNHVGDSCFLARIIAEAGAVVEVGQPVGLAVEDAADLNDPAIKNWQR